ncbi:efflux RND transporter permease subunit [Klebsiella pneumoniae]|uniref:efflux RND transporter permease subunit n=1 Tax=Klebsiella pneumoniae TaxID=573 RepID=UPI000F0F9923|nr:efflux RND transporter permease subunit [Klebsiella pneumoniae]VDA47287.1 Multidrug efflux pump subunit AcrB [Klebsiella pneumoniae]
MSWRSFPHGLEYKVAYETTSFVKASITDVVKTLLEAILLVFLVMYLFLQNFRATLIPTIAVPVVLMALSRCCMPVATASTPDDVRDGVGDRPAGG